MRNVRIYTTLLCPFCMRAKKLLERKGVEYEEIDVTMSPEKREEMSTRANGARTVPQIFVDGEHVGDCERLFALDRSDELDKVLGLA